MSTSTVPSPLPAHTAHSSTYTSYSTYEAKARLSSLIAQVERSGEPIIITRHGKAVARLIPEPPAPEPEEVLAQMRQQAQEQRIAYDWQAVNEPLDAEAWGDGSTGAP
ncbi:MAG: type II toxin-antitoxin system Phd/YefM family antitoxin [Planctomycetota bacterium]|nr:MAG: type II toxin-antitoxin system Phd/YefM family antitoxin [Planctomycetota bacterium]